MTASVLDAFDREIVRATQEGLPLSTDPFGDLARRLGREPEALRERMRALLDRGVIRRIAAVPNHYRLGYRANGMSVWDVDDERISELGRRVGALPFVSHSYRRPRHPGVWPYNLFAMLHARTREEVLEKAEEIREILGPSCRGHDILFSSRILKKTGFRMADPSGKESRCSD